MKLWSNALCMLLCIFTTGYALAWQGPVKAYPAGSKKIELQQCTWQYNDSATLASIRFVLINHAALPAKRIQLSVVARNKDGLTLQHKVTTIRRLSKQITVAPEEQQTIQFDHAFRNPDIEDILIREVIIEFSNGSLEILRQ